MNKRALFLTGLMAVILLAGSLAGCGGGGGSGTDTVVDTGTDSVSDSGDTSAPQVISTYPFHESTGVEMNRAITATFNEAIDPDTITIDSFSVTAVGTAVPVACFVEYDAASRTAILIFDDYLASGMGYIATVTNAVEDTSGNQMTADYTWQFTTGNLLDDIAPTVSFTLPASNASEVSLNSALSVTFSETIDPVTINNQTITLKKDGVTSVTGTLSMSGTTLKFSPTAGLSAGSPYTAIVTTGIEDLAGNPLAENYAWSFATKAVAPVEDLVPPQVLSVSPEDGAQNVPLDSSFSVTFNEPIMAFDFGVIDGRPVTATFNYDYTTVTLEPTVSLNSGGTYTLTIRSKDLAGNIMPEAYIWKFSTRQ